MVWIQAKEELPTLYKTVLFRWKDGSRAGTSIGQLVTMPSWWGQPTGFESHLGGERTKKPVEEVTHWMELPEPPP